MLHYIQHTVDILKRFNNGHEIAHFASNDCVLLDTYGINVESSFVYLCITPLKSNGKHVIRVYTEEM